MSKTSGLYFVLRDYETPYDEIDRRYLHVYSETISRYWSTNSDGERKYMKNVKI